MPPQPEILFPGRRTQSDYKINWGQLRHGLGGGTMGDADPSTSSAEFFRQVLIPRNTLLFSEAPRLELPDLLELRASLLSAKDAGGLKRDLNLLEISEETIRAVDELHGPEALFRLFFLAGATDTREFRQYLHVIDFGINLRKNMWINDPEPIVCDNERLCSGGQLERFNHRLLSPSLSRKLYTAGDTFGSTVYGIGGPKILVSLPLIGADEYGYDAYTNGIDVVTSLQLRGFYGRFRLFDKLDALNAWKAGYPTWLLWFSMNASHSDLVVFVRREGDDLSRAQEQEVSVTPDRVQKKEVVCDARELSWARNDGKAASKEPRVQVHFDQQGKMISKQHYEAEELERSGASEMLETYVENCVPDGTLAVVDESGDVSQYPESHEMYSLSAAWDRAT